ncbi:hypothetical protein GGI17_003881 [Coemansia sp. S146]|nr:hypothetical protein GGI17_003881 [Coemansia sp. S146]
MYQTSRKPSRGTCASTPSPTSSPSTPGLDAPPPEPRFAEYDKQSATLDNIGAWSTVQPNPNQPPVSDDHSCRFGADVGSLSNKYNAMRLDQPQLHRPAPPSAPTQTTCPDDGGQRDYMRSAAAQAQAQAQAHASDVDYTELDEAILRGRSTTLPNIFAVPNPPYRFSAVAASAGMDSSALAGPISPVSNSTFSMLSRHGSMSIANSNRTVSPLGLPLYANPIHQSASLDNHLTSALDLMHHAPIRRFSEFSGEPNSCLALASYSMAPHFSSGGDTTDGINSSGASHGATGRPAFVPSSISATTATTTGNASSLPMAQVNGSKSTMNGSMTNARCEGSAYHQPAAPTRYGSFNYHLPTMREEESPSAPLSPPTFADSVLMRNMGFSAMPLPSSGESAVAAAAIGGLDDSNCFMSNGMTSPLGMRDSDLAPGVPPVATESQPDRGSGAGVSYLPLRVKSMKNLRRPSLDTRSDYAHVSAVGDQVASTFFERATELQSSMSLNHLSGLGRRHSLSTSNLGMSASTSAAPPPPPLANGLSLDHEHGGGVSLYYAPGNGSEYSAYPQFAHFGAVPQGHGFAPTMRPYGSQPGQYPSQQQQYHPFALGSAPITRVAGGPPANTTGPVQNVGPGMYSAHMLGAMPPHPYPYMNHLAYQAQYHRPQMAPGPAAHLTEHPPTLVQPVPLAIPSQQQYLLHQQHHMRRASHPAISSIGAATLAAPSSNTAHSGSHPLLPNPATTITPNMPFADMGKGLAFGSLPKGTRVFVVQFKSKRCDLYFAPGKGMEPKLIPTLAPLSPPIPATAAPPLEAATRSSGASYEPGTYVLVEADRGVDLGMIKEELVTAESILSFSGCLPEAVCADHTTSVDSDWAAEHAGPAALKPASTGGSQASSSSSSSKDVFVKRIFRVADQREVADLTNNKVKDEQKALSMCQDKVQQRKLSMYVADAEFQFDRRKLTFYFTADRRVDFRELVRELFKHFKTRIWMCQLTH